MPLNRFSWDLQKNVHCWLVAGVVALIATVTACQDAEAGLYACRNSHGKISYTNVRSSAQCKPISFKKDIVTLSSSLSASSDKRGTKKYDSEIKSIARRYGVDPSLIKAIIHVESGFNHRAVSRMGAKGLMQLMPGTARDLKVYNPFNAKQNIDGGTRYFRQIMDDFNGDVKLALAAYNAGPDLVSKLQRIPAIPETRNYVRKVMSMYRFYKSGAI